MGRERLSTRDISEAKNSDLRGSVAAMRRAAEMARTTAIQTNTGILVSRDGKPVRISAEELSEDERERLP